MCRSIVAPLAVLGLLVSFRASAQDEERAAPEKSVAKKPAFLGVQTSSDTGETKGALVAGVLPKSPAATAGLRKGDLITRVDDQPIAGPAELIKAVRKAGVGKTVTVTAQRDDKKMEFKAKLEEAPRDLFSAPPPGAFPGGPGLGPRVPQLLEMPDRIRQLQDRVEDLERRLRALEQQKAK